MCICGVAMFIITAKLVLLVVCMLGVDKPIKCALYPVILESTSVIILAQDVNNSKGIFNGITLMEHILTKNKTKFSSVAKSRLHLGQNY